MVVRANTEFLLFGQDAHVDATDRVHTPDRSESVSHGDDGMAEDTHT
jgi:hypothetical protein